MKSAVVYVIFVMAIMPSAFAQIQCPEGSTSENVDTWANEAVSILGTVDDEIAALGPNDGLYAVIHDKDGDDPDPYIVLDMGQGEEVHGTIDVDLRVFNDGTIEKDGDLADDIEVWVSNSPDSGFLLVGTTDGTGTDDFSIEETGFDSIRYVKILNSDVNQNIEIDAVKGICITEPQKTAQVPEFGTFGAVLVLSAAGAYLCRKRK